MRRWSVLTAFMVTVGIALGAPSGAWAIHQSLPGAVPPACGASYPGQCLIQTRLGGFALSPHVVRAGEKLTGKITGSCEIGDDSDAPCPIDWAGMKSAGKVEGGCGPHQKICIVKVAEHSTSTAYQVINIEITNGQGPGYSSDYYAVVGSGQSVIEGRLTDKEAQGVPGVEVDLDGPSRSTAASGPDGDYAADVESGRYRVAPEGRSITSRTAPRITPEQTDVDAPDGGTAQANFLVDAALTVTLKLGSETVNASGQETVSGSITTTEFGAPKPGVTVDLWPQEKQSADQAVTTGPRVLICSAGERVWPTGTLEDPDGLAAQVVTGAHGVYNFTLDVGTVPGSWTLTAWALDASGALITHDLLDASDEHTLTVDPLSGTPPTIAGLQDFVQALNVAGAGGFSPGLASSVPSTLITALADLTQTDVSVHGYTFGLGSGGAILVSTAADTPTITSTGKVNADPGDLVLDPPEWAEIPTIPVSGLATAISQGRVQDLPTFAQWTAGTSVPGWSGSAQTLQLSTTSFEYFGWPYPSTATGTCS